MSKKEYQTSCLAFERDLINLKKDSNIKKTNKKSKN